MAKNLRYPVGQWIKWGGCYYKVSENVNDIRGKVIDTGKDIIDFCFDYNGERARLITDQNKIDELEKFSELEIPTFWGFCQDRKGENVEMNLNLSKD